MMKLLRLLLGSVAIATMCSADEVFDQFLDQLASSQMVGPEETPSDPIDRASGSCQWGYDDTDTMFAGPSNWATACDATCGMNAQSPIDLPADGDASLASKGCEVEFVGYDEPAKNKAGRDIMKMKMFKGEFFSTNKTLQWNLEDWTNKGPMVKYPCQRNTNEYRLWQLHFHWGKNDMEGSEHTVNMKMYPLEVHYVHVLEKHKMDVSAALNDPEGLMVIGVFFDIKDKRTQTGKRFKTTFNSAKNIIKKGLKTPGVQNAKKTKPLNLLYWLRRSEVAKNHYNYQGSLTTPTCNEVVNWVVAKKSVDVWTKDLAKLRELINEKGMPITENWRPVQALNGREINSMGSA